MNKLIIIGNGFDLAHGLKTSYSDFILDYLNNVISQYYLKRSYSDNLIEFHQTGNTYVKPTIKTFNEFIEFTKLPGIAYKSISNFLNSIIQQGKINNWVDLESEYYSFLVKFYKNYENNDSKYFDLILGSVISLNNNFETIKRNLIEYLRKVEYSSENKNSEISNKLNFITSGYEFENMVKRSGNNLLVLNFNYTSVINLYEEELSNAKSHQIINIHGNLVDANNPIIFGYGDEMDPYYEKIENLKSNEFLNNIKSFGYFKTSNYQDFLRFINNGEFEVFIMGHSCGISDRILLNSIFENEKCTGIKIYYYKKSETENDYFVKTQEISRHFSPKNKNLMRKLVVPFNQCEPLT
ncbi:MAG: AbiH family protein [Bacteroidota bacterium]